MKQETFDNYAAYLLPIWDEDSNGELSPTLSTGEICSWHCEKNRGHMYKSRISSIITRIKKGWSPGQRDCSCPVCIGKVRIAGFNDVFTLYPELESQWSKKNTCNPLEVPFSTPVWWVCPRSGGQWKSTIHSRVKYGEANGFLSPFVTGKKVLAGFNDIATTHPHVLQYWDYAKNQNVDPHSVSASSGTLAWWLDDDGNSYQMTIEKKCARGQGSPFKAGKRVSDTNSLAACYPELAAQWDRNRNSNTPDDVTCGSSKKVWWICPDTGLSWQSTPKSRVHSGHTRSPYMTGKRVAVGYNDLATVNPDVAGELSPKNDCSAHDIVAGSKKSLLWVCSQCGYEWLATADNRIRNHSGCPRCFIASKISMAEEEMSDYVKSILPGDASVKTSCRRVISPQELDIYIPSHGIAIEFNGLYWHSEARGKDNRYHYNKWRACKDKGIQLITVWEDDWRDRKDVVKSMLAHKLGVAHQRRTYARNTTVHQVPRDQVRVFCDAHHIQGYARGSVYLGLYDNADKLIAVSVWRENSVNAYLERYCTAHTIVGGMGKLLSAGKRWAKEHNCTRIITFSDHEVSDGSLYRTLGFTPDKELALDYKYIVGGKRTHKFGYRLKRFRTDPNLRYQEGMTERELACLNGLERVWDCGKTRWVLGI